MTVLPISLEFPVFPISIFNAGAVSVNMAGCFDIGGGISLGLDVWPFHLLGGQCYYALRHCKHSGRVFGAHDA